MNLPKAMDDEYTLCISAGEYKRVCSGVSGFVTAVNILAGLSEKEGSEYCSYHCHIRSELRETERHRDNLLREVSTLTAEKEMLLSDSRTREEHIKEILQSLAEKDAEIQSLKQEIEELKRAHDILEHDYAELELKYHFSETGSGDGADDVKQEHSCECSGSCRCQM